MQASKDDSEKVAIGDRSKNAEQPLRYKITIFPAVN
jgi:hypothetical protein